MARNKADPFSPLLTDARRLYSAGRFALAEQAIRGILAARPDHPDGLHLLGVIAYAAHRYADAEALLQRALSRRRGDADLYSNLGLALQAQGKYQEGIRAFRRAVSIRPGVAVLHLNLGSALKDSGDIESALASLSRATALDPALERAHFGRALCLLSLGRVDEAWAGHAWRDTPGSVSGDAAAPAVPVQHPCRFSPADMRGKRILVLKEQGLGDELFFLRYGPLVRTRAARLAYRGSPRLSALVSHAVWLDAFVEQGAPLPAHDVALFVGDLPLVAGEVGAGLPAAVALAVDPPAREAARVRLADCGPPPYLGVTWRAGLEALAGESRTLRKSIPLEQLATALSGWGGTAVVLQRTPFAGEVDAFAGRSGLRTGDLSACNDDLDLMLALLETIDEYVGVSNTNMHLRAGVQRSARVLIPFPPEWRWTSGMERSPWFPDFPLYREDPLHGWDRALQRLRADIAARGFAPTHP